MPNMTIYSWIAVSIAAGAAIVVALLLALRWLRADRLLVQTFRQAAEGDFDGAVARLKQAAADDDPTGARLEALGFLYFQRSRWTEAADAFGQAAQRNSGRVVCRVYQAHALARSSRIEEAKALLATLNLDRPHDVSPLCGLALVLVDAGDVAGAAEQYWKARQLFQQYPQQQSAAGMGLLEQCAQTISRTVLAPSETRGESTAAPQ